MSVQRFKDLFRKFLGEDMTSAEVRDLQSYVQDESHVQTLDELLLQAYTDPSLAVDADYDKAQVYEKLKILIQAQAPVVSVHRTRVWKRIAVAAIILVTLGAGVFYLFTINKGGGRITVPEKVAARDVAAPSTSRATITLAGGERVFLDSASSGTLATQGAVQVRKLEDGQISYAGQSDKLTYNTLFNPRGSKVISLTLGDGTQVWLNAESSLRYPAAFTGNRRPVEITGEAYFEVAHDSRRPFIVSKGGTAITVLGTHFNVNAYDDEPAMKVTLLEGSVSVNAGGGQLLLKPGQQAVQANQLTLNSTPDIKQVLAWKNGVFDFGGQSFTASMRQLERWYNIKVVYDGPVPSGRLGGKISRDLTLMQVVKVLDGVVATFKFENNVLHILP